MVTYMMVIGRMTRHTALASTRTQTVLSMKDIGSTISSMVKARSIGLMELNMKDSINMEKKTVTASFFGLTARVTVVTSSITIFMEKVHTLGQMAVSITVTGKTTKCMAKVFSPGQTAENMKASTTMIKNRVMVFFTGQMDDSIMAFGWQASSKELVSILTQKARYATVAGKMVSV